MLTIDNIIKEIASGRFVRDDDLSLEAKLPLFGEFEAMYYSNLRRNLQSDLAHLVIHSNQCLDDLTILREIEVT